MKTTDRKDFLKKTARTGISVPDAPAQAALQAGRLYDRYNEHFTHTRI